MFHLKSPAGKPYTTDNPREANDLIMLHGYRRVRKADAKDSKAEGKEKADQKPANKAGSKPTNKAKN